jgi:putative transposase
MPNATTERELNDRAWERVRPLLPPYSPQPQGGRPFAEDHACFENIVYVLRNGIRERDLPGEFGAWDAVYNLVRRLVYSSSQKALFDLLTASPELGEVRRVLFDSTNASQLAVGVHRSCGKGNSKTCTAKFQATGLTEGSYIVSPLSMAEED